jgi:hypothetical protein
MIDFGICDSPVLDNSPELVDICTGGSLTLQDMAGAAMAHNRDVPFAYIQSKMDIVQEVYYDAIALTMEHEISIIDDAEFFGSVNDVFAGYLAAGNDNALTYMVDSPMHTYTLLPIVYHATSNGAFGGGDQMSMLDWVGQFPLQKNETASSVCEGDVKEKGDRPKHYTRYCAEEVENSYTQQ